MYENYNKFISATDTIREMQKHTDSMEDEMYRLKEKVLLFFFPFSSLFFSFVRLFLFSLLCQLIFVFHLKMEKIEESSEAINQTIGPRRERIEVLLFFFFLSPSPLNLIFF